MQESTRRPFITSSSWSPCLARGLLNLDTFSMREKLRKSLAQPEFSLGGLPVAAKLLEASDDREKLPELLCLLGLLVGLWPESEPARPLASLS